MIWVDELEFGVRRGAVLCCSDDCSLLYETFVGIGADVVDGADRRELGHAPPLCDCSSCGDGLPSRKCLSDTGTSRIAIRGVDRSRSQSVALVIFGRSLVMEAPHPGIRVVNRLLLIGVHRDGQPDS